MENGINQTEANDFNVSVPWLNTQTLNGALVTAAGLTQSAAIENDILLVRFGNYPACAATESLFFGTTSSTPYEYFGIGLNATGIPPGTLNKYNWSYLGSELWSNTVQPPANNITVLWAGIDPVNNVFVENLRETQQFVGYSLATGKEVWGPTAPQASLDYYGSEASGSIADALAYGNLYSSAYAGIVYCYSSATGNTIVDLRQRWRRQQHKLWC